MQILEVKYAHVFSSVQGCGSPDSQYQSWNAMMSLKPPSSSHACTTSVASYPHTDLCRFFRSSLTQKVSYTLLEIFIEWHKYIGF